MGASDSGHLLIQGDRDVHHEDHGGDSSDVGRPYRHGTGYVVLPIQEALRGQDHDFGEQTEDHTGEGQKWSKYYYLPQNCFFSGRQQAL